MEAASEVFGPGTDVAYELPDLASATSDNVTFNISTTAAMVISRYDTLHPLPILIHVISCLGIAGNVWSFVAIHRCLHTSIDVILQSLVVVDVAFLVSYNLFLYGEETGGFRPLCACAWLDVVVTLATTYTGRLGVGTCVYLGLDRYIALSRPLLAARVCTMARARRNLAVLALVLLVTCLEVWFRLYYYQDDVRLAAYRIVMFYYGDSILWYAVPYLALLVFTAILLRAMIGERAFMRHVSSAAGSAEQAEVMKSLVVGVGVALLFLVTQAVSLPLQLTWRMRPDIQGDTYRAMRDAARLVLVLNSSLNFCVFWLTSANFRHHVDHMTGCVNKHVYQVSREEKVHQVNGLQETAV